MKKILRILGLVLLTVFSLLPNAAYAHDNSPGYSDIVIELKEVSMKLYLEQIFLLDVAKTPWDGDPMTDAYLKSHADQMVSAVAAKLIVEANGQRLQPENTLLKITNRNGVDLVEFGYKFPSAEAIQSVSITNDLYVRNNKHTHTNFATIKMGSETSTFIFQEEQRTYTIGDVGSVEEVAEAASLGEVVKQFLKLGVEHILTGYDHLLFLFSLLLVVRGFKDILKIVTAFTAAHSVTLILAALGVVELPSKLVEAVIAASICYVALENWFRKEHGKRWLLTLVFGLIHGFGFAGVLSELAMPEGHKLAALLTFNLGVELGQLAVVAVILPILLYLRRMSWHRTFVRAGSGLIFLLGLFWLVERLY